jgi:hypothetical protein
MSLLIRIDVLAHNSAPWIDSIRACVYARIRLDAGRWDHHTLFGAIDLPAMALQFNVGDRHAGRR